MAQPLPFADHARAVEDVADRVHRRALGDRHLDRRARIAAAAAEEPPVGLAQPEQDERQQREQRHGARQAAAPQPPSPAPLGLLPLLRSRKPWSSTAAAPGSSGRDAVGQSRPSSWRSSS